MSALKLNDKTIGLIAGKNFGYLATINKDGSPHVTPVWVDREGDLILVNTVVGRAKVRNTKRNPKVAIAITDASNQYNMVTYRGTVVEQTTKGASENIDKLYRKYVGKGKYTGDPRRIILKIRPEHYAEQWVT
jgi:PPOX class probable F420-dependent enzyme